MTDITEVITPADSEAVSVTWSGSRIFVSRPDDLEILAHDPESGETNVYRRHTGAPGGGVTGLASGPDGRIFGCQSASRRIVLYGDDGSTAVPADQLDGHYHNNPRYADVDRRGRVWFADAHLGIRSPGPQVFSQLAFASVLLLEESSDGWSIRRMTTDTVNPTVVSLNADDSRLYVVDTVAPERQELRIYEISDGSLGAGSVLTTLDKATGCSGVTGLDVDARGRLVVACAEGVLILSPDGNIERVVDIGLRSTDVAISETGAVAVSTAAGSVVLLNEL